MAMFYFHVCDTNDRTYQLRLRFAMREEGALLAEEGCAIPLLQAASNSNRTLFYSLYNAVIRLASKSMHSLIECAAHCLVHIRITISKFILLAGAEI